jgi:putative aldouronate transport system permease protein
MGTAVPRGASRAIAHLVRYKFLYLMVAPVVAYFTIFHYAPIYGLIIAFKDYVPARGVTGSPWVGLAHYHEFFVMNSMYVWRIIRNTVLLNFYGLLLGFPAPIILAILLNEVESPALKRTVQTITYVPYFISLVVVVGMLIEFFARDGVVNQALRALGREPIPFITDPRWFRPLYIGSGIWQTMGWNSIIYLAAISGVDPNLYEAAEIDGAGRFRKIASITLPGIFPTIVILFLLQIGHMMDVGIDKVLLMYNPMNYETADVIQTFVYRTGLLEMNFSYGTAVGLFNSVVNFSLLLVANRLSRNLTHTSLW